MPVAPVMPVAQVPPVGPVGYPPVGGMVPAYAVAYEPGFGVGYGAAPPHF